MGTHLNEQATFTGEPHARLADPAAARLPDAVARTIRMASATDKGSGWKIPNILDRPVGVEQ